MGETAAAIPREDAKTWDAGHTELLAAGGRGGCGWRPGGQDRGYMTEVAGTARGRGGGHSRAARPVTPCPGLPQPSCPFP